MGELDKHAVDRIVKAIREGFQRPFLPPDLDSQRPKTYFTLPLDLTAARNNVRFPFPANYFYITGVSISSANIDIRLNERSNDVLNLTNHRGVRGPFKCFYITNAAQPGVTIDIACGVLSHEFEIIDQAGFLGDVNLDQVGGTAQTGADLGVLITSLTSRARSLDGDTGTQITKYATATNATAIIHTVTAGKTFYLSGWALGTNGGASGPVSILIRDDSDVAVYYPCRMYQSAANNGVSDAKANIPPIKIPADYDICAVGGAASLSALAMIEGWEE